MNKNGHRAPWWAIALDVVTITVGRVGLEKNLAFLLRAFSRAVLEAMAVGLPVLGIPSLGIEESIRDGDTFAQRMIRLAADADLRARLAEGAR